MNKDLSHLIKIPIVLIDENDEIKNDFGIENSNIKGMNDISKDFTSILINGKVFVRNNELRKKAKLDYFSLIENSLECSRFYLEQLFMVTKTIIIHLEKVLLSYKDNLIKSPLLGNVYAKKINIELNKLKNLFDNLYILISRGDETLFKCLYVINVFFNEIKEKFKVINMENNPDVIKIEIIINILNEFKSVYKQMDETDIYDGLFDKERIIYGNYNDDPFYSKFHLSDF